MELKHKEGDKVTVDGTFYDTGLFDFSIIEDTNSVKLEIYR